MKKRSREKIKGVKEININKEKYKTYVKEWNEKENKEKTKKQNKEQLKKKRANVRRKETCQWNKT